MSTPAFDFTSITPSIHDNCVVKPILMAYLHDMEYSDFSLYFPARKKGGERKPDGYFHPSTHPLWTERQLYYYLTGDHTKLINETLTYMSGLSITMGTAFHGFIQHVLGPKEAGLLLPPAHERCPVCHLKTSLMPKKNHCWEHGVIHEETRTRGHMDGLLSIKQWGLAGFEFKSSNQMKLSKIQDNDVELYRTKWPEYYGQNQDYMRITGLRKFVVLFVSLGYPWEMREFTIEYDYSYAYDLERKYTSVIAHAEQGTPPQACCPPHSATARSCFARNVCPIGLL